MSKTIKFLLVIFVSVISLNAQSSRSLNNDGVDLYNNKKYTDAEVNFKKGIEKDTNSYPGHFNLGDSYYRQGKYDEAIKSFNNSVTKSMTKEEQSKAFYNMGGSYIKGEKYKEAIEALKKALKLNPKDTDAKYNLSYAIRKDKDQQQQNKDNKDKNKNDKNKDKNKDQDKNKDNKDNKDKNKDDKKNQDQNKPDDKKDQDKQNQQQPKPNESKMSKQEAERILDAIKNNEKDLQKQLRKKTGNAVKTDKDW